MNFLESCRHLIGLDSTPSHGNLAAAEFLGRRATEFGLDVELQRETLNGIEQCNVLIRPASGGGGDEVLFQTHLDTVEAGHFGLWTKTQSNPFNASIYDDELYGLGAADTKLDFLCKLEAARDFGKSPQKNPFILVGTFGAQTGMSGAIKLIRRKKIRATRALVGEPTNLRLVHAGVGLAVVEISVPFSADERAYRRDHDVMESTSTQSRIFSGKAAHSSDPSSGQNAIIKMLDYLSQLPDGIALMDLDGGVNYNSVPANAVLEIDTVAGFRDPIVPKISRIYQALRRLEHRLTDFRDESFSPSHATMNMGQIRSTEAEVRLVGSCRLPPSVPDSVYEDWMRELETAVTGAGATFRVRDYRRGFSTAPESNFVQGASALLRDMGMDGAPGRITVATEANVFSRLGIECLVFGPGQNVGNSHAPNEKISVKDLKTATEFYRRAIERFCL